MKRIFTQQPLLLTLLSVVVLWLMMFWQGLSTAYSVWLTSEIYNHCLLILPIAAYLIYEKWPQLGSQSIKCNYFVLVPLLGTFLLQLFAEIGDIKILMHIATFTALPLMLWMVLGNQAAKTISFPLFFILFAIPIGDQLIPALQELTTDIAVPLLSWTQVPVYRNGLYLDIPEGRFLVAEACSGISFLITTIAFGFLYAYLFFKQRKRQLIFIAASFIVPILANALRVYGIILTGHLTNMEHAVGADHLIYGGVFFGFVLFLLILFGELIREPKTKAVDDATPVNDTESKAVLSLPKQGIAVVIGLVIFFQVWFHLVNAESNISAQALPSYTASSVKVSDGQHQSGWSPQIGTGLAQNAATIDQVDNKQYSNLIGSELFAAYFNGKEGQLISSTYRVFDQKHWSLLSVTSTNIGAKTVKVHTLTSPRGNQIKLLKWYNIAGVHFASESKGKLFQAWQKLLGKSSAGTLFILRVPNSVDLKDLSGLELNEFESAIINTLTP